MDDLFLAVFLLTLIAIPVIILMILWRTIRKNKPRRNLAKAGVIVVAITIISFALFIATSCDHEYQTVEEVAATYETDGKIVKYCPLCEETFEEVVPKLTTIPQNTTEIKKEPTTNQTTGRNKIETQFIQQGFTADEAVILRKHFETFGVKDFYNLHPLLGSGIDSLQSFQCTIYDYSQITLNFTVENRVLCYAEITGIPTERISHFYINLFGNLKVKTYKTTTGVVMYDIWDENGEIIEGAEGYKAVFDYENEKFSEY